MNRSGSSLSRPDFARVFAGYGGSEPADGLVGVIVVPQERIGVDLVVCHGEAKRQPVIRHAMNDAPCGLEGARRTRSVTTSISKESVLSKLQQRSCLDLRQLAALHGVDAADETLARAVADLRRRGKISCIGGRGARASFVPATFER